MKKCRVTEIKRENGQIILLFAGVLVVLIFFIGISLDLGLIFLQRNELMNLCQIVREDRFTYQDSVRYADNPGLTSYQIVRDTLVDNGFDGDLKVYFYEEEPKHNYRKYEITTQLSKQYSYTFLRVLGATTATISVSVKGGENYGEDGADVIWYPPNQATSYNGLYHRQADGTYHFSNGITP